VISRVAQKMTPLARANAARDAMREQCAELMTEVSREVFLVTY
jgi:hypothetical protein